MNQLHKHLVTIIICVAPQFIYCQNLLQNGSFENWNDDIPSDIIISTKSPDFYKRRTRIHPAPFWDDSIPQFFPKRGFDGISYIGLHSTIATVESIAIPICNELDKNHTYKLRFAAKSLNLPSYSPTNRIEIAITDSIPFGESTYDNGFSSLDVKTFKKRVKSFNIAKPIAQKYDWDIFESTVIAKGNEKYIIIYPPLPTSVDTLYYYLYDNFVLEKHYSESCLVQFSNGKSDLHESQELKLNKWIKQLPVNIDSITIKGYADKIGSAEDNLKLSLDRTNNVQSKIKQYYNTSKLKTYSYGEKPYKGLLSTNHNRVVEIRGIKSDKINRSDIISSDIVSLLQQSYDEDQRLRSIEISGTNNNNSIQIIDSTNRVVLNTLFEEYGYLGVTLLNSEMKDYMGIMTLHQDLDFQLKHISKIEEAADNNECSLYIFAYLLDKIKVAQKEPQIFGSQLYYSEKDSLFKLYPVSQKTRVNERRKEYGLGRIEDYIKSFNER